MKASSIWLLPENKRRHNTLMNVGRNNYARESERARLLNNTKNCQLAVKFVLQFNSQLNMLALTFTSNPMDLFKNDKSSTGTDVAVFSINRIIGGEVFSNRLMNTSASILLQRTSFKVNLLI